MAKKPAWFVQTCHFSNVFIQRTFVVVNTCSHLHNKLGEVRWSVLPAVAGRGETRLVWEGCLGS